MSRHHNPVQRNLLEAANQQTLEPILEVVERQLHEFEPVTLATCVHRIAKVCKTRGPDSEAAARIDDRFLMLMDAVRKQVGRFDARGLANILWALGSLAYRDDDLLRRLVAGSRQQLQRFMLQNLSNAAWALARLQFRSDELFMEMSRVCEQRAEQMTTQDICSLLWAYDVFGLTEANLSLFESCMRKLTGLVHGPWNNPSTTPHTTSLAYSALAIADNVHLFIPSLVDSTFEAIMSGVRQKLKMVTAQDFCRYLAAFAKAGRADELSGLFEPVAAALEQAESKQKLDHADVALLFWALGASRMHLTRGDIGEFSSSAESYATKLAKQLPRSVSLQDLSAIAWGLASAKLICAPRLFDTVAKRTLALLDGREGPSEHKDLRAICGILWAFAASGLRHVQLFTAVADIVSRKHATVPWKDLVDVIWACAFVNLPQLELLAAVAGRTFTWSSAPPGAEVSFASRVQAAWAFAASGSRDGTFDASEVVARLLPEQLLVEVLGAQAEGEHQRGKERVPQYVWPLLLQLLASQPCFERPLQRQRMDKAVARCRGLQREKPLEILYTALREALGKLRVKPLEYDCLVDGHFFVSAALIGPRVAVDVTGPDLTVLDVATREVHLNGIARLKHQCLELSGWRVGFVTLRNFGSAERRQQFLRKLLKLDADDASSGDAARHDDSAAFSASRRRSRSPSLGSESA